MQARQRKLMKPLVLAIILANYCIDSFVVPRRSSSRIIRLSAGNGELEPDIVKLLADAQALLAKTKEEMAKDAEAQGKEGDKKKDKINLKADDKKKKVVKKIVEDSEDSAFTTDGNLMSQLSEDEDWEERSLFEVFEDEIMPDEEERESDIALGMRDIGASIQAMRIRMNQQDYEKIFDKKNRFIGENN